MSDVPDTVGTPEGDGEFAPDEAIVPVDGLQTPPGGGPSAYESDKRVPTGLEKVIDEISTGKLMP